MANKVVFFKKEMLRLSRHFQNLMAFKILLPVSSSLFALDEAWAFTCNYYETSLGLKFSSVIHTTSTYTTYSRTYTHTEKSAQFNYHFYL